MERKTPKTEKPPFRARCRVFAVAALLWAALAAVSRWFLPAGQAALPQEGTALAWAGLRLCVVIPMAEELAFRGAALYLLQPLGGSYAVVVQALLFAALHGSWSARVYALGMGLIFGWAAQQARSVWPGCVLHMINNCLVLAAQLAERGMG